MIEPLRLSFVVACGTDHAFKTWTSRTSSWWPADHTMSAEPGVDIVFEPRAGGRIFERTSAGIEIEWGEITAWEPPHRLCYLWHIGTDRSRDRFQPVPRANSPPYHAGAPARDDAHSV